MLYFPVKVKLTYEFTYVKQIMSNIEQANWENFFQTIVTIRKSPNYPRIQITQKAWIFSDATKKSNKVTLI